MGTEHIGEAVARREGIENLVGAIAELSGSDRASVLMAVMARAADSVRPTDVLRRHLDDRFVRPSNAHLSRLRAAEDRLLAGLGADVELVVLAPVVPFGTHRALGATPQDNVLTTTRGTEVAADPTNGLALEAAARRRMLLSRQPRSSKAVDLGTCQRVIRGQRFSGPMSFSHFGLVARVTSGRDAGNYDFEVDAVVAHVDAWKRGLVACGIENVSVTLTDFSGHHRPTLERIAAEVDATTDDERVRGRGYYDPICFQIDALVGGRRVDIGDGGLVPWSSLLLSDAKERTMISAIGVDRVAMLGAGRLDPGG